MARPIKHEVSRLISEGRQDEARELVERAVREGGNVVAGARILHASKAAMWRWVSALGVASLYDPREAAAIRWEREREKKKILDELV